MQKHNQQNVAFDEQQREETKQPQRTVYDFSHIDFSDAEIQKALAKAYAILLANDLDGRR